MGIFNRHKKDESDEATESPLKKFASDETKASAVAGVEEELQEGSGLHELVELMRTKGKGQLTLELKQSGNDMHLAFFKNGIEAESMTVVPGNEWFDGVARLYTEEEKSKRGAWNRALIAVNFAEKSDYLVQASYLNNETNSTSNLQYRAPASAQARQAADQPSSFLTTQEQNTDLAAQTEQAAASERTASASAGLGAVSAGLAASPALGSENHMEDPSERFVRIGERVNYLDEAQREESFSEVAFGSKANRAADRPAADHQPAQASPLQDQPADQDSLTQPGAYPDRDQAELAELDDQEGSSPLADRQDRSEPTEEADQDQGEADSKDFTASSLVAEAEADAQSSEQEPSSLQYSSDQTTESSPAELSSTQLDQEEKDAAQDQLSQDQLAQDQLGQDSLSEQSQQTSTTTTTAAGAGLAGGLAAGGAASYFVAKSRAAANEQDQATQTAASPRAEEDQSSQGRVSQYPVSDQVLDMNSQQPEADSVSSPQSSSGSSFYSSASYTSASDISIASATLVDPADQQDQLAEPSSSGQQEDPAGQPEAAQQDQADPSTTSQLQEEKLEQTSASSSPVKGYSAEQADQQVSYESSQQEEGPLGQEESGYEQADYDQSDYEQTAQDQPSYGSSSYESSSYDQFGQSSDIPASAEEYDVPPSYTEPPEQSQESELADGNLVLTEADIVSRLSAAHEALFGPNGSARDVSTVLIRIRSLGSYYDALTHVRTGGFWDQRRTFDLVSEEVLDILQLKSDSYVEGSGSPLAMSLHFTPGIPPVAAFDYSNEEAFVKYKDQLPAQQYIEELRMFPRTGANIPEHMNQALTSWTF